VGDIAVGEVATWAGGPLDPGFVSPLHLEGFLYGLVLVESGGKVLYVNRKARQMLMPGYPTDPGDELRCCDLICGRLGPLIGGACVSSRAAASSEHLPEVRMDIEHDRSPQAAWVSSGWWGSTNSHLLFHLRPGNPRDRRRRASPDWHARSEQGKPALQVSVLRPFMIEGINGPIGGRWVEQRPGQLLKFLISQRGRAVPGDQIAEAIWSDARPEVARNRLRFYVHALRERLEPERGHRSPSRFIVAKAGGYQLDTSQIWIDADEFETEVVAGFSALRHGLRDEADAHFAKGLALYHTSFLVEDPFEDWGLEERERLQGLAARALRSRIDLADHRDDLEALAVDSRRLAEMEPFDADAQKLVIEICLRRGRRSEAYRRYSAFRKRMLSHFGEEPDFDLLDVCAGGSPAV
jgi:DNA-binding SARP family transcriptional activator